MWRLGKREDNGRYYLLADDFTYDPMLVLNGDFPSEDEALAFIDRIADVLNHSKIYTEGPPVPKDDIGWAKAEVSKQ